MSMRFVREAGGVVDPGEHVPTPTPGPLVWVDDPDDPRLDLYRDLADPASRIRLDVDRPVFVVEGRLAVARLLTSAYPVRSLLVDDHQVTTASDLVEATRATGAPVFVGSRPAVARTVGFSLHRGVVALADRPPPTDAERLLARTALLPVAGGAVPVLAMLEGVNDHENIGAVFRNAAAFGVAGVLLDPTCADPLYRRSIRVSVGHILHLPFARLVPWPQGFERVRAAGYVVAALSPHHGPDRRKTTVSLAELTAQLSGAGAAAGVALLLGAEGRGLTTEALEAADLVVRIPMADGVDSLNVATAAAIAFHALALP
jgi:tRNA G18 (ribose-2'-O)-methylase SpoU